MSTLQIHITAGPQAGARLQLNQSPVTFGRSGDCSLVLDLPVVSRLHGELHLDEAGQWLLTNHSANGTRVGRKKANKKPVPLADGAAIIIGDTEVFRVHIADPAADTPPAFQEDPDDAAQPAKAAPGAGAKGKSKLWIGLGVWIGLCLVAMIFFATLKGGDDKPNPSNRAVFYYPGRGIDDLAGREAGVTDIRRLLAETPPREDPSAARYSSHLDRARQAAEQRPSGLYESYKNYQRAITYSKDPAQPFDDPRDVTGYKRIISELSEIIYDRYVYAYNAYHTNEYQQARDTLDRLRIEYYNVQNPDDILANHIRRLRNAAHSRSN